MSKKDESGYPKRGITDAAIKALPIREKPYKDLYERGLYVLVRPEGSKLFRFNYRFMGKEKTIALGKYPEVSLALARKERDTFLLQLRERIDPSEQRKRGKLLGKESSKNSFRLLSEEFLTKQRRSWSEDHFSRMRRLLEKEVWPKIGSLPIASISTPDILAVLRKLEEREVFDTTHRAKSICSQVFDYAIQSGRCEFNPCANLKGALTPVRVDHRAAITDPKRLGELLRLIDTYRGQPQTRAALALAPMLFVRPGELTQAQWKDFDLNAAEWRFVISKTKTAHIVPLAKQAMDLLSELHPLTCHSPFVFPGERSPLTRPISTDTLRQALRSLGVPKEEATTHGFRATARTLLEEVLDVPIDLIEHQVGHTVRDPLGRAYNRTTHLEKRREMMQRWADYLLSLRTG
jgi:integrase